MKVGQIKGLHSLCIFLKCQERNRETCLKDNLFQGFGTHLKESSSVFMKW